MNATNNNLIEPEMLEELYEFTSIKELLEKNHALSTEVMKLNLE